LISNIKSKKMKKIAVLWALVLFSTVSFAQQMNDTDIPSAVRDSFQKLYSGLNDVDWEMEGGNYEAEFDLKKTETSVIFDAQGNLLETESEIKTSHLPDGAVKYIEANYAGEKIREAAKITDAKGIIFYEADVKGKDLIFDSNGNYVSNEAEDEESEEEDD
jgi:hypothetical protein